VESEGCPINIRVLCTLAYYITTASLVSGIMNVQGIMTCSTGLVVNKLENSDTLLHTDLSMITLKYPKA